MYNISSSHYKILELEYNLEYKLLDNIFLYMNLEKQADLTGGQTFPAGPKGSKDPNVTKASEGQKALKDWKTILED